MSGTQPCLKKKNDDFRSMSLNELHNCSTNSKVGVKQTPTIPT